MLRTRSLFPLVLVALAWLGAAHAETVWYVGQDPDGRTVVLELDWTPEAALARGRLLHGPARPGQLGGLELAFEAEIDAANDARAERPDDRHAETADRLRLEAVATDADGATVTLAIAADAARSAQDGAPSAAGPPDPFGEARIEVGPLRGAARWETTLSAIGTRYALRAELDDGSFEVSASAPFFYADPWRTLPLHDDPAVTAESVVAGLTARAERPRSVSGQWWEVRRTEIVSLSPELVSARTDVHAYAGGAHPNLRYASLNVAWDGSVWTRVDVCGALEVLDRPCDEAALRARVIAELRARQAAWTLDGEVDGATPWLLEPFTVGPTGLRFDYAPYEVGPYASGPFSVEVPFEELP
ncbi:MAG: RsiV family protein [Trueperaceae bacterium]|nr:RsiV family protein [Trueperaceae bacterium]